MDPRYAIISVERHNMFGHLAATTIATLQRFGGAVYRTDENGAVTIVANGGAITIAELLSMRTPSALFAKTEDDPML
ncbi:MAG: hypothetical protein WBD74_14720 [Candidatus Aquilonibacter sp.]